MKVLYLLGNGFDLNLGLKTSYQDFYNHYQDIVTDSENIQKLKSDISYKHENWADLELALGNYTNKLNSAEEFYEVFEDIVDKLGDYLETQEKDIESYNFDKQILFNYLAFPENSLSTSDKNKINIFKSSWSNHQHLVDIITFNYTKTIEKIFGKQTKNIELEVQKNKQPITFNDIEHIHGYVDNRMVLGVNDISQISNKSFKTDQNVIDYLIKKDCNTAQKHEIDSLCYSKIKKANLICIFGCSIGETDKMWWELIGEHLNKEAHTRLLIFSRGEKIPQRFIQKQLRFERSLKKIFLDKTNLSEDEKEKIEKKIIIGYNTPFFKLEKKPSLKTKFIAQ
jgi:hypothetical protein